MKEVEKKKSKIPKKYFIFGLIMVALCLAITIPDYKITEKIENKFLSFVSANTGQNYTIDGDKVYMDDDKVFLSAYPHTVSSSQWVYFNLTSKVLSGEIDAMWGFNTETSKPTKAELYKPHYINWTTEHSETFLNVSSYPLAEEPCDYGNEYNSVHRNITYQICGEWNYADESKCLYYNKTSSVVCYDNLNDSDAPNYTAYWTTKHSKLENWIDITNKFNSINYEFQNMTKWYYLKNVSINQNTNYQIRAWVDVPIGLSQTNGKYFWAIKPSSETLNQAIANNHFYYLDPWFNSSWTYKKNITINHSKVSGSQVNFPILINLTDTDLRDDAQADGDDIVFTNSTGSQLDHEIEYFNGTDGRLVAWVRIPELSNTTDTVIEMYYGNAGASSQENATGVWDSNFMMVQHMQETPTAYMNDSTSNNNDGTTYNMDSADQVAGQIDGSLDFNGGNDYVDVGAVSQASPTYGTVSLWYKADVLGVDYIYSNYDTSNRVYLYISGGDFYTRLGDSAGVAVKTLSTDTWYQLGLVWDNGDYHSYVDGIEEATGEYVGHNSMAATDYIGSLSGSSFFVDGIIDEVRISNVARTAGWIATEYNNQFSPDSFYSVGGEEEEDAEDTTDPTYSNIAHNTTIAGTSINFSIDWNDNSALNPNGQYIFSTNNTGTWVNESTTNFTSTPQSLSVIKTLNSTVGISIGYRWYAFDNASNVKNTEIFSLTTTSDQCSPTLNQDWDISDTQVCDAVSVTTGTGDINILSSGSLYLINSANVTTTKLNLQTTGNQVFINSGSEIRTL